jgi:hypothetical protein
MAKSPVNFDSYRLSPAGSNRTIKVADIGVMGHKLQRDNYDGRLPTIKLAKSGSRRVARRELPV